MPISIATLIEYPRLGLRVRAGRDGLEQEVSWAYVSELQDPTPFLEGGELILTGGIGMPTSARGQIEYIARLQDVGVAGVAIAQGARAPRLTRNVLKEAETRGFPLMELPEEVPFIEIIRLVAAANEHAAHQRLLRQLQIFETLQMQQALAAPTNELIERLSAVSGLDLYVASPSGHPILEDVATPPPELAEAAMQATKENPIVPGGYCVEVAAGGRTAARLVAVRRGSDSVGLAIAQHVATVVGIAISSLYQRREVERRENAELFAELLAAHDQGDYARRLVEVGFQPMKEVVIAAVASQDGQLDDVEIHHRLRDSQIPSLLTTRGELLVLIPGTPEAIGVLAEDDLGLTVGVSAPFRPGADWGVRWRQARWSLERAAARGGGLVHFSQADRAAVWLPPEEDKLRAVVEHVLGPVLRYDDARNTNLILSLRKLFAHDRRAKPAAAELGIHQHTLAYRVQTIERLTGRKLRVLEDLVDLWLAMKALDVLDDRDANRRG